MSQVIVLHLSSRVILAAKNQWSYYAEKPLCQYQFEKAVAHASRTIADDNPYLSIIEGKVSAIDVINHKQGSCGIYFRPKLPKHVGIPGDAKKPWD